MLVKTDICHKKSRGNCKKYWTKHQLPPRSKPEKNSKTSPRNMEDAWAPRWSKHNSIYLIVTLVSLVSSAPLRDYRLFLIWKKKIKYTRTVSVVMPACSHASFSQQLEHSIHPESEGTGMTWMMQGHPPPYHNLVTARETFEAIQIKSSINV